MHTSDNREESRSFPEDTGGAERAAGVPRPTRRRFLQSTGFVAAGAMVPGAGYLLNAGGGSGGSANSGQPVNLVVDATAQGARVPRDFTGLSFERGALNINNAGVQGYFFSPSNTELVTLFRNAGIRNVRIGGNTIFQQIVAGTGSDGYTGVDELFAFAAAAGANVIYSLRMWNSSNNPIPDLMAEDAAAAQYIWARYSNLLSSFSIGNEPDWHSYHLNDPLIYETVPNEPGTAYPSYIADWRNFAAAVHQAVPNAKYSGPDTGNYGTRGGLPYVTFTPDASGVSWTEQFTEDEVGTGLLKDATTHYYVGGSPFDTTGAQAIDNMLSTDWVEQTEIGQQPTGTGPGGVTAYVPYPWLYNRIVGPTVAAGLPVRMTEANDYLTGIPGASDAFAGGLWALDFMHWWAAHGSSGVDFHNKQWIYTDTVAPALGTYTAIPSSCEAPGCGNYRVTPKGYAMKAFDLGSRGQVKPLSMTKSSDLNVTAYAVGGDRDLYVTVINKTHGAGATDAQVTIEPRNFQGTAAASLVMDAGEPGDPSSMTATIGGAEIGNSAPWQGTWTALSPDGRGRVAVTVRAASAVVVRIHR